MTPILALENVTKRYDPPDGGEATAVLRDISLALAAGDALAVVGPSGSGKSTLLNIMGTLDRPTSGRVLLDDTDLATLGDEDLAAVRNHRIGFIFQLHHLLPQCTALENVLVPTLAYRPGQRPGTPATGVNDMADAGALPQPTYLDAGVAPEDRARKLLERVGLGSRLSYRPGQLSGGERQRVAVARALVNRPALLLADEPTGQLDRAAAEHLAALLTKLNREEGVTLVVVTHSPALAARMGRVLELRDGRLVQA
jgi:predicted ABC-type transport system involved in lysophospholipase L1 biosynthesis ATPase subunit